MITNIQDIPEERLPLLHYLNSALALWLQGEPIPYIWGGQNWEDGVDCSGFVILGLIEAKILPDGFDDTAKGLCIRFMLGGNITPQLGDLAFFGRSYSKITHVGMYYHDGMMIHAGGGGRGCTTKEIAYERGAWVRAASVKYRSDFLGFGRVI